MTDAEYAQEIAAKLAAVEEFTPPLTLGEALETAHQIRTAVYGDREQWARVVEQLCKQVAKADEFFRRVEPLIEPARESLPKLARCEALLRRLVDGCRKAMAAQNLHVWEEESLLVAEAAEKLLEGP